MTTEQHEQPVDFVVHNKAAHPAFMRKDAVRVTEDTRIKLYGAEHGEVRVWTDEEKAKYNA